MTVRGLLSQSSFDAGIDLMYSLESSPGPAYFSSLPDISAKVLDDYCLRSALGFRALSEKLNDEDDRKQLILR